MELLLLSLLFVFGTIVGSFLNVLICRYNTGTGILGRSFCFSCGTKLKWYELLPVLSFIFQKRRCRTCGSLISWQYICVELGKGALFTAIGYKTLFPLTLYSLAETALLLLISSVLVVIVVYDFHHKIIPDLYVALFVLFSGIYTALHASIRGESIVEALIYHATAAALFFLFFAALWYFSGGRAMGFGDAKLAVGVGTFLGIGRGLLALMISFWSGALVGIFLLLARRKYVTMKTELPFAPFIIFGVFVAFFVDKTFFDVFLF